MSQESVKESLRSVQFLETVSEELLDQLAKICTLETYQAGDLVFRQGGEAESVYLVLSGTVALEICAAAVGCKRVLTLGHGEMLGWSPILEHGCFTATARCQSDVKVLRLPAAQLLAVCERHPALGYEFMKRAALSLAKRLSATRLQLMDVFGTEMPRVPDERSTPSAT